MKKFKALLAVTSLLGFWAIPSTYAQGGPQWRGGGGWGSGSQYNRLYDAKTVETISGEVVAVESIAPVNGMTAGMHVQVKTEKGTISVHLGPAWFLENQDLKIEPKDQIEVKGSRVSYEGKPAIIAAEVTKDDSVLKLRDATGVPVWSGWRRR